MSDAFRRHGGSPQNRAPLCKATSRRRRLRPPEVDADLARNKDLIRRWVDFSNSGFAGSLDQFVSTDYIGHLGAATINRDELERLERQFCTAFPDAHHTIDDLIAEHDRVVLRTTARVMHRGHFEGIEPTGRSAEFTGLVVYRIKDDKVVESWGEIDFLRLIRELRKP